MNQKLNRAARSAAFLTLLLALLLGTSHIFAPKDNKSEFGMDMVFANGILGERENSIDALIVGDSESYSSFSPMHMWNAHGFTSYVCGTAAQPLYDSYRFIGQAFAHQSPSVVILETNAIFRAKHAGSYLSSMVKSRFSLFEYHNRWKSLQLRDLSSPVKYTWTDDYKGYIHSDQIKAASTKDYMAHTEEAEKIPDLNLLCLQQIIRLCEENDAQLVLVSTPSPINWNYARHNAIQAFAEEHGLTYLDMNLRPEIGINWMRDTRDMGDHLNFSGARKVSEFFGSYLKERFPLPDHRSDESYSSWNDAYRRYAKALKL